MIENDFSKIEYKNSCSIRITTLITLLVLILSANLTQGQGFVKMDTIENPTELKDVFSGLNFQTIHVDFNGDGLKDYICQPDYKPN